MVATPALRKKVSSTSKYGAYAGTLRSTNWQLPALVSVAGVVGLVKITESTVRLVPPELYTVAVLLVPAVVRVGRCGDWCQLPQPRRPEQPEMLLAGTTADGGDYSRELDTGWCWV